MVDVTGRCHKLAPSVRPTDWGFERNIDLFEAAGAADLKSADLRVLGVRLPAPTQIDEKQWFTRLDDWMALKRRKRRGIFDRRVCQKPHNPVVF
jgi:hypothetical protein